MPLYNSQSFQRDFINALQKIMQTYFNPTVLTIYPLVFTQSQILNQNVVMLICYFFVSFDRPAVIFELCLPIFHRSLGNAADL